MQTMHCVRSTWPYLFPSPPPLPSLPPPCLAAACRGDYDARLDWAVSRRALAAAFLDAKAGKRTCADAKE